MFGRLLTSLALAVVVEPLPLGRTLPATKMAAGEGGVLRSVHADRTAQLLFQVSGFGARSFA